MLQSVTETPRIVVLALQNRKLCDFQFFYALKMKKYVFTKEKIAIFRRFYDDIFNLFFMFIWFKNVLARALKRFPRISAFSTSRTGPDRIRAGSSRARVRSALRCPTRRGQPLNVGWRLRPQPRGGSLENRWPLAERSSPRASRSRFHRQSPGLGAL